jgi:hypothetical protein
LIILHFPGLLISQSLSPSILSSQGGSSQFEGKTIEWTLGEIFVETAKPGERIITQGFHQPLMLVKTNESQALSDFAVYPNPVEAILHIDIVKDYSNQYTIKLFDSKGDCINTYDISKNETKHQLDMSKLLPGIYLLKISNSPENKFHTYWIVKY